MLIEIVSPERKVFEGEIRLVQAPGVNGSFELLNNHAPIISTLQEGTVRLITSSEDEVTFEINSGILECLNNKVIILAELR
ncbi:MAG: ATP synthase F1 subunit epsilon [Bacteroidetes bacterium RIFOXYA12_FULL_35_11]|nr:MAG: ATP synthase F1 subunit epsilon [Bacteroidetes bacterium GWF2_35_48]OFY75265.1 MAG: ATP synthase F1 subunit epsilon [Bacteroidetes bacterium RIFOXYA12_FULL_35_11]OFY96555.1 MAG: ATP synthase F1 subunit epsilon [Bacteroidetes bacterium RIFOXYB2_FULL_35_7]OFY99347.1 MAG: ATP synthase F1 subunit epsilon [Bacteroidetes bacterium RIFOXYC12_FULL_35_7]HBX51017.1 ATP synthase F1 subunit epsilon [Bacteroidales bacterium]